MRSFGKCGHACTGGRQCCLNAGIKHQLHICNNPFCPCHSSERYALLLALWLVWLPFVGGQVIRTSATGCGHDGWPKCEGVRR